MGLSLSHIILVSVVFLIFFGAKRLPSVMGDLAKGYRAFIKGLRSEDEEEKL